MKKLTACLLSLVLLLSLAACQTPADNPLGSTPAADPSGSAPASPTESTPAPPRADWPSNEFTDRLPTPAFSVNTPEIDDTSFFVTMADVSLSQLKDYVAALQAAGFDRDAVEEEESLFGITIYTYTACDADGWQVSLTSAMGVSDLLLEKP